MRKTGAFLFCLAVLQVPSAFGFSTDGSSLSRSFSQTSALTNSVIVVKASFTNAEAVSLRGFYYADQVPSGLSVTALGMTLNGASVTNYLVEVGTNGDVYPGCTPYRWVLEEPTGFSGWSYFTNDAGDIEYEWSLELPAGSTQANPLSAGGVLQIAYAVSSTEPGQFDLQQFSWAAFNPKATNAAFGYSEAADTQTLTVLAAAPAMLLAAIPSTNGIGLILSGSAEIRCALEASTNLLGWLALATNTLPWTFSDTNYSAFPTRFFRARWVP